MNCVVAGVAPKNQPGTAPTVVSQLHVAAAVLAGALLLAAMALVFRSGVNPTTRRVTFVLALLTWSAAGIFRLLWGTHVYGLTERVLLALGMGWLSALAAGALMPSGLAGKRRRTAIRTAHGADHENIGGRK
jgi:peptidoglycan/LPS O-acetylase OafA/YrhL